MDDEQGGGGFSGLAYYQLGRWSAEGSRKTGELLDQLNGRGPITQSQHNYAIKAATDWRRECLQLRQVVEQLEAQLAAANSHQAELKQWGDRCLADRDRWKERAKEKGEQTLLMSKRASRLRDELEELKGNI